MLRRCAVPIILLPLLLASSLIAQQKLPFPPPPEAKEAEHLGAGVQRTMTLLATSTAEHRHKVRILFYGQSITEQDWSKQVTADLRKRFPHADLEIENRAIGGFASQLLIRPAEHDLYPFYPDLVIFHVYGSNKEYEEIIKATRSRTTAEILMQKDHVTQWPPEVIDKDKDKGMWWDDLMNHKLLPEIAKKYDCGLVDIRSPWLAYLKENKLEPKALLKDGVHLNDHGNYLMAELVKRYLVHKPELKDEAWHDLVKTYEVGNEVKWKAGKMTLAFEGNRVDVLGLPPDGKMEGAAVRVLIDGKKPSEFPGCYRITRPQPGPWSPLALTRVDWDKPLIVEDWTLKVTSVADDGKAWQYEVRGSKTGADGEGDSGKPFVSKSGRVKIDPAAWFPRGNLKVGYEIKWQVLPMFVEEWKNAKNGDAALDNATTVVQGLPNGPHKLELFTESEEGARMRAVRVYKPPVR